MKQKLPLIISLVLAVGLVGLIIYKFTPSQLTPVQSEPSATTVANPTSTPSATVGPGGPVIAQLNEDAVLYSYDGRQIGTFKKKAQIDVYFITEKSINGTLTRVIPYFDLKIGDDFAKSPEDKGVGFIKLSAVDLPEGTDLPVVTYLIQNQKVYRIIEGQKTELESLVKQSTEEPSYYKVEKHKWQCFFYSESNPVMLKLGEFPGLFFFDASGVFLFFVPCGFLENSYGLYFSPNEKYIGQDEGTWIVRGMFIWSFPDFKRVAVISTDGMAGWGMDDDYLFFTALSGKRKPGYPGDLADFHYIAVMDLRTGKETPVKMHDALSEYKLEEIMNDYLLLTKVYITKSSDWANSESWKEERIKIPNPFPVKKP